MLVRVFTPLYGLADCNQDALRTLDRQRRRLAGRCPPAVQALRNAVRMPGSAVMLGDFSVVDISWVPPNELFLPVARLHRGLLDPLQQSPTRLELRQRWKGPAATCSLSTLRSVFVGAGPRVSTPRRVVEARRRLGYALNDEKLLYALRLPFPENRPQSRQGPCRPSLEGDTMVNVSNRIKPIGKALAEWWQGLRLERSRKPATLRRAAGPTEVALSAPYQRLYRRLQLQGGIRKSPFDDPPRRSRGLAGTCP